MAKQEPGTMDGAVDAMARVKEPPERDAEELHPRSRSSRTRGKEGVYVFEAGEPEPAMTKPAAEVGYGSMQPTSYWSVPEVRDFPVLLAHFGKDFEGISNFMKTKTPIMVRHFAYCLFHLIRLLPADLGYGPSRQCVTWTLKDSPFLAFPTQKWYFFFFC